MDIFEEIKAERKRQDAQWGGADHDDSHSFDDWLRYIQRQSERFRSDHKRARFVKIAALAVAALESIDRRASHAERGEETKDERSTT